MLGGRLLIKTSQLYNIIQQNESRSQFHIAAAMSKDSSDVAFLTWLGALFLPPSVVAVCFNSSFSPVSNPLLNSWIVLSGNPVDHGQLWSHDCKVVLCLLNPLDLCRVVHPPSQDAAPKMGWTQMCKHDSISRGYSRYWLQSQKQVSKAFNTLIP